MRNAGVVITGIKELDRALKSFEPRLAKAILRKGLRDGAKAIQAEAKADAPRDTGALRKAIKVRAARRTRKGVVAIFVRIGDRDFAGKTFYGAFQEYGAKGRRPGRRGGGPIVARRFMKRALDSEGPAARRRTLDAIRLAIRAQKAR